MDMIPIRLSVTNDYLINAKGQYILIDTGYVQDYDLFCQRLKEAKVKLTDLNYIILTHHHDDHCGLLNQIVQENSQVKVVMTEETRKLLLIGENDQTHGGGLLNKRINCLIKLKQHYLALILGKQFKKEDNLKFPPYVFRENDLLVKEGTTLQEIGINLSGKIITTPGHTIDSISVLLEDGSCFVGDAAANFLQFAGTKYCVVFIMNLAAYYESWRKIIQEGAKIIYPAHGKSFDVCKLSENLDKNKARNIVS